MLTKKMNFDEKDIVRIDEKEAKSVLGTEVVDSYIHLMKDMGRLSTSWISKVTTKHSFIKFLDPLSGLAVFGKNKIVKKAMAEGKGRLSLDVNLYKRYVEDTYSANPNKAIKKHAGSIIGLLFLYKKYASENLKQTKDALFGEKGIFLEEPDLHSVLTIKDKFLKPRGNKGNATLASASNLVSKLAKNYGVDYSPKRIAVMITSGDAGVDVYSYGRMRGDSFALEDLNGFEESPETGKLRKSVELIIDNFKKQTSKRVAHLISKVDDSESKYLYKWMSELDSRVSERDKGRMFEDFIEERLVRLDKVEDIVLDLFTQSEEYLEIVNFIDTAGLAIMLTLLKYRGENEKAIGRKNIIFNGINAFKDKRKGNSSSSKNVTLNLDDNEGDDGNTEQEPTEGDDGNTEQEPTEPQSQPSAEQSRQPSPPHSVKINKSSLTAFAARLYKGLRGMNGDDKDKTDY